MAVASHVIRVPEVVASHGIPSSTARYLSTGQCVGSTGGGRRPGVGHTRGQYWTWRRSCVCQYRRWHSTGLGA
eukprot:994243-Rhodomonas_salina.2